MSMTLAKILVPLRGTDHDAAAMATALAAAAPLKAHIEALFVRPNPAQVLTFVHGVTAPSVIDKILEAATEEAKAAAVAAHKDVVSAARHAGVTVTDEPAFGRAVTCSWHEIEGRFPDMVALHARYCDLVCFGRLPASLGVSSLESAFLDTLMHSGKPVLLAGDRVRHIGEKIAIGWDGHPAASRAVAAAMDFLEKAKAVEILNIKVGSREAPSTAHLQRYLKAHGVTANEHVIETGDDVGEQLQSAAMQFGCDLLVTGAYGHSWVRETIFGGVTEDLVAYTKLPILMAH
jgi:nucleotide-binding universal stress UspA family protein